MRTFLLGEGEVIFINDEITVRVLEVKDDVVRLGIEHTDEDVLEEIQELVCEPIN